MSFLLGLFVLLLGLFYLGTNLHIVPPTFWTNIVALWPLLIILLGLRLLIRNSVALALIFLAIAAFVIWTLTAQAVAFPGWHWNGLRTPLFSQSSSPRSSDATPPGESGTFHQSMDVSSSDTFVINLGGNYDLKTTADASATSVTVDMTGPQDVISRLNMTKDGHTLTLNETRHMMMFDFRTQTVTGTITLPQNVALDLELSGVTKVALRGHQANVKMNLGGSSSVSVTDSTTQDASVTTSGTSQVAIDQCQGTLSITTTGASKVTANKCTISTLTIKGTGSSNVSINDGSITDATIDLSGATKASLPKPTGKIDQQTTGVANISYR